jgi:hypothetical protein
MSPELLDYVKDGGVIALLLLFVVGGMRETWVWGTHYRAMRTEAETRLQEMRSDRDYWRSLAEQALDISREGVGLAERRHRPVVED